MRDDPPLEMWPLRPGHPGVIRDADPVETFVDWYGYADAWVHGFSPGPDGRFADLALVDDDAEWAVLTARVDVRLAEEDLARAQQRLRWKQQRVAWLEAQRGPV